MDLSIEIIGEVIPEGKPLSSLQSELQVLYDNTSVSQVSVIDSRPLFPATPQRPVRTRRPVRTLVDEQNDQINKKKTRIRQQVPKQQTHHATKRISKQSVVRSRPLMNKGIKRKENDIQVVEEFKRPTKACRSEVGGAGTLQHKKRVSVDDDVKIVFEWDPAKIIAERQGVDEWQARGVINLFDQENTLPFIARYRKEKTGNLDVEKLREIQNSYSQLKHVQEKIVKIFKDDKISQKVTSDQKTGLLRATTIHEVEHLTASLKGNSKRSHAERARELGLNDSAVQILAGQLNKYTSLQELTYLVNPSTAGLKTLEEIEQGIKYIIADIISKDSHVLDFVRNLMRRCNPKLECCRKKQTKNEKSSKGSATGPNEELCNKYKNYFNYNNNAWGTRPHQVLAINRGENKGVLTVKVIIPEGAYSHFYSFCQRKWLLSTPNHHYHTHLIVSSTEDSWGRLVKPFMQRQIRSQLTEMAEIASVEVFTSNLKKLLLTPPVRGKTVLAIDPGFHNGCKIAVTSLQGDVLLTTTIYPFRKTNHTEEVHWTKDHNARTLREIVNKFGCELIAVGNGTACRQTEQYLSSLINSGCFEPHNVQYTIINESGASQYSVSPEARTEFPGMDPNHVSAVSLARRLQDPLLEYVKVHPMHLGVGMYQHDIPERLLHASLDSVMTECVSFVGVDINAASEFVLRKLSGLNKNRAAKIVEYRKAKGPFITREQIKSVKGIGPRTFEQCAGFIRIMPATLEAEILKTPDARKQKEKEQLCYLDQTMIHPESYAVAYKFMKLVNVQPRDIGTELFLSNIREFTKRSSLENLAQLCETSIPAMQVTVEGLSQPVDFDIRTQFEKPLFRKGFTSINDLTLGTKLTGTVRNMTHFGAFVDIGVGQDGLIHLSKMLGMRIELGSIVEVTVSNLEKERGRIGLTLERIL